MERNEVGGEETCSASKEEKVVFHFKITFNFDFFLIKNTIKSIP